MKAEGNVVGEALIMVVVAITMVGTMACRRVVGILSSRKEVGSVASQKLRHLVL